MLLPKRSTIRNGASMRVGFLAAILVGVGTSQGSAQKCDGGLSERLYTRLLERHFSSLMSSQSGTVLGNFASVDLKEAEAAFAGTSVLRGGAVLATKVSGGAADGLLPILQGNEFNSKLGATVQLNLLSREGRSVSFDCASYYRYQDAVRGINRDYALRSVEIENGRNFAETTRGLQLAELQRKKTALQAVIDTSSGLKRDSLMVELARVQRAYELKSSEVAIDPVRQRYNFDEQRATQLKQAEDSLDVMGFSIGWLSVEYGIQNVAFRLFDPALPVENQVRKRSFATHTGGIRYSRYRFSPGAFETRFWSVSLLASFDHNLSSLTKVELIDRQSYGSTPDQRVSENKYTAYSGSYRSRVGTLTLGGDYYQFLFNKNQAAVHTYPAIEFKEGERTAYNLGLGFLLTARSTAKEPSTLNAEIFLNLTDLTNARDSEQGLFGRSGIGLRLTFPITFRSEI
jgi:hypothetical protein